MTATTPRRTSEMHDANRRSWDDNAGSWAEMRDRDGLWRRCPEEPELGFAGGAYELIGALAGSVVGKDVAVIGSGDNHAVFALAGMKAHVTSIDISERQLETASARADQLDLSIDFVRADATDLGVIADRSFNLVCSTNGFFVWIADLHAVYGEVFRILKPGGHYVFYDVHPFQRPWADQARSIEVDKPYWQTGPIRDEKAGTFEFNWTMADLLNPGGRCRPGPSAYPGTSRGGFEYLGGGLLSSGHRRAVDGLEDQSPRGPAVLAFGGMAKIWMTPVPVRNNAADLSETTP